MAYGIDLGSSALKVVALRRTLKGFKAVGASRKRAPRAEGADAKTALLRTLLEALGPAQGSRPGVVGLAGRDINLQLLQQPAMKPVNYRVMMGYELDQRKGEATDLYIDYCTLRVPDAFTPQYLALIGIGKSAYIDDRIDLAVRARVDVRDAVPNPFALYAAYRNAYDPEGSTNLLIDLGSDNMDLAFVRGGRLIFARNVGQGANVFDKQIAGATGCEPAAAESMKAAQGTLSPAEAEETEEQQTLRGCLRSAAGQIVGFINSAVNNAKMQLNDRELAVDKVYLSGGGARLKGLADYLAGALKVPVEPLDPFRRVDLSALEASVREEVSTLPTDMAIATGLAQLVSPTPETAASILSILPERLKVPVEPLDPFRRVDLSALEASVREEVSTLPTDMAIATGLAQLVSPTPETAASILSILPERLKKRRNFFRTTFWLGVGAAVLAAALLGQTALLWLNKNAEQSRLQDFTAKTHDVRKRIDDMDRYEREQREAAARTELVLGHMAPGRIVMETVSRLRRALPPEVRIRELRLSDGSTRKNDEEPLRAAFTVRRRGLVSGEIESENDRELRLKGQPEPFRDEDIVDGLKGGVVRWASAQRALLLVGEIDESIRGGAREALNVIREQLTDSSRGIKASLQNQKASDKAGWRRFEIVVGAE